VRVSFTCPPRLRNTPSTFRGISSYLRKESEGTSAALYKEPSLVNLLWKNGPLSSLSCILIAWNSFSLLKTTDEPRRVGSLPQGGSTRFLVRLFVRDTLSSFSSIAWNPPFIWLLQEHLSVDLAVFGLR